MMKFLALTLYLMARLTLTFTSAFATIGCQKANFQKGIILVI